ncbi:BTB/POZ protein [Rhizophagus irregularis DAOM 181602=DAOM 197198]|nr:BTB/POZ protein [Rhizophagus irregularis DAOM 181602=DAOM 197198]
MEKYNEIGVFLPCYQQSRLFFICKSQKTALNDSKEPLHDEYYDVTIEVGEDPDVKIFRAHMNILCHRSPYLRRSLASNKKNNDNFLVHIKLPNISSEIFQYILEYIYGGILSLNGRDILDFLKILAAADELCLQELIDYLQKHLIENKDDLQMKEVEVWEHVLKWGLAQNSNLIQDSNTWTDDDFKKMKATLQNYPDSVSTYNILRPRKIISTESTARIIDSQIVDSSIVSTILSRIDKTAKSKFEYKFELLLRGSRDGFTPKKFHELCDEDYEVFQIKRDN